jgi:hypothetical protein
VQDALTKRASEISELTKKNAKTGNRRGGGVIAAVLHELVKERRYTDHVDLCEDLKTCCARLRIPYDGRTIQAAIEQVEGSTGRPLVSTSTRRLQPSAEPEPSTISRADAATLLEAIYARVRRPV